MLAYVSGRWGDDLTLKSVRPFESTIQSQEHSYPVDDREFAPHYSSSSGSSSRIIDSGYGQIASNQASCELPAQPRQAPYGQRGTDRSDDKSGHNYSGALSHYAGASQMPLNEARAQLWTHSPKYSHEQQLVSADRTNTSSKEPPSQWARPATMAPLASPAPQPPPPLASTTHGSYLLVEGHFPRWPQGAALWEHMPHARELAETWVKPTDALPLVAVSQAALKPLIQYEGSFGQQQLGHKSSDGSHDSHANPSSPHLSCHLEPLEALRCRVHHASALLPQLAWGAASSPQRQSRSAQTQRAQHVLVLGSSSSSSSSSSSASPIGSRVPRAWHSSSHTVSVVRGFQDGSGSGATVKANNSEAPTSKGGVGQMLEDIFALKVHYALSSEANATNSVAMRGASSSAPTEVQLRVEASPPALSLCATPIAPLPLMPTPLAQYLLAECEPEAATATTTLRTGFIALHESRQAVLLLDSDVEALSRLPLIGCWLSGLPEMPPSSSVKDGITQVSQGSVLHHSAVWAAAARFSTGTGLAGCTRHFCATSSPSSGRSSSQASDETANQAFVVVCMGSNANGEAIEPACFECSGATNEGFSARPGEGKTCARQRCTFYADVSAEEDEDADEVEEYNGNGGEHGDDCTEACSSSSCRLVLVGRLKPSPAAHAHDMKTPPPPAPRTTPPPRSSRRPSLETAPAPVPRRLTAGAFRSAVAALPQSLAAHALDGERSEAAQLSPPPIPSEPGLQNQPVAPPSQSSSSPPSSTEAAAAATTSKKTDAVLAAQRELILEQQRQLEALTAQVAELRSLAFGLQPNKVPGVAAETNTNMALENNSAPNPSPPSPLPQPTILEENKPEAASPEDNISKLSESECDGEDSGWETEEEEASRMVEVSEGRAAPEQEETKGCFVPASSSKPATSLQELHECPPAPVAVPSPLAATPSQTTGAPPTAIVQHSQEGAVFQAVRRSYEMPPIVDRSGSNYANALEIPCSDAQYTQEVCYDTSTGILPAGMPPASQSNACVPHDSQPSSTAMPCLPKDAISDLSLPTMTGVSRNSAVDLSLEAISQIYPSGGFPLSPQASSGMKAQPSASEWQNNELSHVNGGLHGTEGTIEYNTPVVAYDSGFEYDSDEADSVMEIMQKYRR